MPMRKLVVLSVGIIGQDEIEGLISVENEIQALQQKRDRLADYLLARHLAGVEVEPGIFRLGVEIEVGGGQCEHRLVIR